MDIMQSSKHHKGLLNKLETLDKNINNFNLFTLNEFSAETNIDVTVDGGLVMNNKIYTLIKHYEY